MNKKRWNENSSENIRTVKYPSGITFEALHLYHTYTQLYLFVLPGFCVHHKAFLVHCDWLISDLIPKKFKFSKKKFPMLSIKNWLEKRNFDIWKWWKSRKIAKGNSIFPTGISTRKNFEISCQKWSFSRWKFHQEPKIDHI